jgi:hypothetical protein
MAAATTEVVPEVVAPQTVAPQTVAPQVDPAVVGGDAKSTSGEAAPSESDSLPAKAPWRYGKVILVLLTVVVVVVIVAIIRKSADNSSGSGSLTPTSVTHKKPPATQTTTPAVIPVSSSVKSAFSATSVELNTANAAVTKALTGGAAQSPAQIAQEVAPYVTALDTFNYKNHFLVWPASLQVPAEDLTLRTDELIHYLSSISSASPATLTSWFAQFHSLARLTETTDNSLRKDIGLPASNSYPTT